jgi:hypothetical protein
VIASCHVALEVGDGSDFAVTDFRVIAAAYETLKRRPGVTGVDSVSTVGTPYFVVTLEDVTGTGIIPLTTLIMELESSTRVRVIFAEDGGVKTSLVLLRFEVIQ